ncbi:MAG: Biotin synthase [Syntrophaceae bacterium PtaU1.Bin231]|nr:MAG: Biotin synthase [Syntrophaceae bacterium PtaU1.Bin231]
MCYAIPGRVVAVDGAAVTVEYYGQHKTARNEFRDLRTGDYVYAQGGFVVEKVSPAEAESVLATWKEIFFELQETDLRLSRLGHPSGNEKLGRILDRAAEGMPLNDEQAELLLGLDDPADIDLLYRTANFLRHKYHDNSCCVHGIIEMSNACTQSCAYCGISKHNRGLRRYRMTRPQVFAAAQRAVALGFKALVLQSGQDCYPVGMLADLIGELKNRFPLLIFVSFGELSREGLEMLYAAGARGILLRFETSDGELYRRLHPESSLERRLQVLRQAGEIGFLVVTGGLIGLPGQTRRSLLNDLRLAASLHPEMVSFGPFLPHPDTPLAEQAPPACGEIIKCLAAARLLVPRRAKVLVTTSLETLDPGARRLALQSGCSSVMLNVSPMEHRSLYSIYPDRAHSRDPVERQIADTLNLLKSLGRAPTDLGV